MRQCLRIVKKYLASVKHENYKADVRCCFVIYCLLNAFNITLVWKGFLRVT